MVAGPSSIEGEWKYYLLHWTALWCRILKGNGDFVVVYTLLYTQVVYTGCIHVFKLDRAAKGCRKIYIHEILDSGGNC